MEDNEFRYLFQRILNQYELAPNIAEKLLQRILKALSQYMTSDE